jgi:Holliday junction DNA helicase RuvA
MVLELRDKLPAQGTEAITPISSLNAVEEDVLSALMNLGYQRPAAEKALASLATSTQSGSFDSMFRQALARLSK